jgi:autotransporter-associated beta strand protein
VLSDPTVSGGSLTTLGGAQSVKGIFFNSAGGIILDSSPNAYQLTIAADGISVNTLSSTNTINDSVAVSKGQTWTNNSTGPLTLGGYVTLGSTSSNTLTVAGSGNTYFTAGLTGSGGFTSNSTGLVAISGSVNYTGVTTLNGGTLQYNGNLNFGDATTDNGILIYSPTNALVYSKVISGSGALVVTGLGTVQLGGAETYTGVTTISGGTLQVGSYNGTGGAAINNSPAVIDNGTFFFGKEVAQSYPGPISGTGSVGLLGAGSLTLGSTNNSYSGGTVISQGTLQLTSNNNLPLGGSLTFGSSSGNAVFDLAGFNQQVGTIGLAAASGSIKSQIIGSSGQDTATLTVTGNSTFSGTIQDTVGAGGGNVGVTINGAQVTFTGTNTYTGPTKVASGSLVIGSSNALSTATSVTLGAAGTSGTLDLGGFSPQIGTLATNASALPGNQIVGNSSPSQNSIIALGSGTSFTGTIQDRLGSGTKTTGVAVTSGTVTLAGANSYSGPTNVNGGLLLINGSQSGGGSYNVASGGGLFLGGTQSGSGTFSIASGGTLGGGGSITSPIVLSAGAALVPGSLSGSAGTLSLSSLSLNNGSLLQFGLSGNTASGNGMIAVGGLLSLNGTSTVNVVNLGTGLATGSYELFTFGSLAGTPSSELSLAPGVANSRQTASFLTSGNGVFLKIVGSPQSLVWTGSTNATWSTATGNLNWTNNQNSQDFFANGDNVAFNDSSGSPTISIPGLVLPGSLLINSNINTFTFTGPGSISGNSGLTKTGTSALVISNTNSYTGTTAIQSGTLVVAANNALGPASVLLVGTSLSNGTLDLAGNNQQVGGLGIGSGATASRQIIGNSSTTSNSVLTFASASPSTFAGTIRDSIAGGTQSVGLNVASGQLTLSGSNSYSGGTTISGGTLQLGGNAALPSGPSSAPLAVNGTLDLNGFGIQLTSVSGTGTIVNNSALGTSATLALGAGNASGTFAGVIQDGSGKVSLEQLGSGVLTLTGSSTFSGAATVNSGTLQIGNGGFTGSVNANVVDNGTLAFNRAGVYAYAGSVGGTGSLMQVGPGSLVLAGSSSFTGGATVAGGTLTLGANNALPTSGAVTLGSAAASGIFNLAGYSQQVGSLAVGAVSNPANEKVTNSSLTSSATLTIAGNTSFGGVITDAGAAAGTLGVTISSGFVQLSGTNSYSGATTINSGGTLQVNGGGAVGSGTPSNIINDNGTLIFDTSAKINPGVIVQGSGTLIQASPTTLVLDKAETFTGTAIISAGTLQLGTNGTALMFPATSIVDNALLNINRGGTLDFTSPISGSGSLAISGGGTIILDASNTFTGNISLTNASATLQIGNGNTNGSIANNNIAVNCQLNFDRPDNYLYTGSLSGSGTVYQNGTGTLNLQGNSSGLAASLVVVDSGSLEVSGTGVLNVPGTLRAAANGAILLTDSSVVTTGKLVAKNANGLIISGNAAVNIAGGNLQIGLGSGDTDTGSAISATQNGGAVTLTGTGGTFIVGSYFSANSLSTATYTQNAGNVSLAPGVDLQFANSGGSGTYNLNGGLLSLPGVTLGSGSGSLNLGAGTLQADAANMSFIAPQVATTIGTAGTTIDNHGNAITLAGNIGGTSSTSSLMLDGSGSTTLSGTNTYQGGTTVSNGILVLQGAASLLEGSSLTIGNAPLTEQVIAQPSNLPASHATLALAPVPEPGTLNLLIVCAVAMGFGLWRRKA